MASIGFNRPISIWNPHTAQLLHQLEVSEQHVVDIVFSSSGREIASTWSDETARVWNTKTGLLLYKLEGVKIREYDFLTKNTAAIAFSPDGRSLAYQSLNGGIWIVQWQVNELPVEFEAMVIKSVEQLIYSNNGKILACASDNYTITLWDVCTTRHVKTIQDVCLLQQMSFSADDSRLNTQRGCLKVGEPFGPPTHQNHWNNFDREWIKEGDRRMLWLPPAFRDVWAYHDGLFVFFDDLRKPQFIRFSQDEIITEVSD